MNKISAKVFIMLRPHINTHSEMTQGVLDYACLHGPWQTRIMGIDDEFSPRNFRLDDLDGAIIEDQPTSRSLMKMLSKVPTIVFLNEHFTRSSFQAPLVRIHCDNVAIANAAADFLLARATSDLAFVNAPGNPPWSKTRAETFVKRVKAAGRACHVWHSKRESYTGAFPKSFAAWLAKLPTGTAIFAANDPIARHILNLCLDLRIAVPERLALLGVDNNRLICETATPTLSSISLTTREAGFRAAQLLERMMRGHIPQPGFELQYSVLNVVERGSTANSSSRNTFVERLQDFISDRLSAGLGSSLTIKDAVNSTGLSRRSAEMVFKRETGRTLHSEMIRQKLKFAMERISGGQDTLELIASECGFANASHLCRLFKAAYGKSPSLCRSSPSYASSSSRLRSW